MRANAKGAADAFAAAAVGANTVSHAQPLAPLPPLIANRKPFVFLGLGFVVVTYCAVRCDSGRHTASESGEAPRESGVCCIQPCIHVFESSATVRRPWASIWYRPCRSAAAAAAVQCCGECEVDDAGQGYKTAATAQQKAKQKAKQRKRMRLDDDEAEAVDDNEDYDDAQKKKKKAKKDAAKEAAAVEWFNSKGFVSSSMQSTDSAPTGMWQPANSNDCAELICCVFSTRRLERYCHYCATVSGGNSGGGGGGQWRCG